MIQLQMAVPNLLDALASDLASVLLNPKSLQWLRQFYSS